MFILFYLSEPVLLLLFTHLVTERDVSSTVLQRQVAQVLAQNDLHHKMFLLKNFLSFPQKKSTPAKSKGVPLGPRRGIIYFDSIKHGTFIEHIAHA